MTIFKADSLSGLKTFANTSDQLAIYERKAPSGADAFFQKLMAPPFGIAGKVYKASLIQDIRDILNEVISDEIQADPFYENWISDMAQICETFCDIESSNAIAFWVGSQRRCRRYHIDNVPRRMLVTYAGKGTEWLPDDAADRKAHAAGKPNDEIIKDIAARQFMNAWDVAIFRGGPKGLLHRTPDNALNGPSIMMRLDHPSFWENVLKHQKEVEQLAS